MAEDSREFSHWEWSVGVYGGSGERPFWPPLFYSSHRFGRFLYIFFTVPFFGPKTLIMSRCPRWKFPAQANAAEAERQAHPDNCEG